MKKRIFASLLAIALVCAFALGAAATGSGTEEITFRIAAQSLTLSDAVNINFKVEVPESADVSTLKLLVWEGVPTDKNGNVSYTKDATYTDFVTEDGKKVPDPTAASTDVYLTEEKNAVTLSVLKTEEATAEKNARYVFRYTGIAAAEYGKTVYACAYYMDGETAVYTKPVRYSVAQYIYNMQGTEDAGFAALLASLAAYGNASSVYFGSVNEPTGPSIPVTNDGKAEMHTVTLTGGTFADGFTTGKFLAGETVTVSVPEGYTFYGWETDGTFTESTENSITVTEDATYTPVYGTAGLTIDENCTVTGYTGTATATEVVIPSSVKSIGDSAFDGCTSLTSVTFAENSNLTSIGNNAFTGCTALESITIPEGVESIGDSAFYYCTALESIEIPEGVESIGAYAFNGCTSLTSIEIPSSVTSIGAYAFNGCTALESIEIPSNVTSIGDSAFSACTSLTSIEIPASVTSIGDSAFSACTGLTSITVAEGNTAYKVEDGALYTIDGTKLICCPAGKGVTTFEIPSSVKSIGDSAFDGCTSLTSVTFAENSNLTSIGNNAFNGCTALESIEIPASVTSIGIGVFKGCTSLTSVTFAENSELTSLGGAAFAYCTKLKSIIIPEGVTSIGDSTFTGCTALESITIPKGVTSIGICAFDGCTALESITIPKGVTSIGIYAFNGCTTTINYAGTEEEWKAITKGFGAIPTDVTVIYDYTGET